MWMWSAHMFAFLLIAEPYSGECHLADILIKYKFQKEYSVNDEDTNFFFTVLVKNFTIFLEKSISIGKSLCQERQLW